MKVWRGGITFVGAAPGAGALGIEGRCREVQGGACGEHPEGAVRTARVVTHSMKCVSSYYIYVGVSWILFLFHYEDDVRAAVFSVHHTKGMLK